MKDIVEYEGLYAVTSCGKVWSYKRKKFLKQRYDKDGYLRVTLSKKGKLKTYQVHRLVALAFVPNIEGYLEINHKDEVKEHNWADNLEWCTHEYNINYGSRNERAGIALRNNNGRHGRQMNLVYCAELDETFTSMVEASMKTGISQADISKACSGKRATAGKHPVTGERLHWSKVS